MVLRVLGSSSGVRLLASSVRSITSTVLKIISPYCIHIFVMYVGCALNDIVVPPVKLHSMQGEK